MPPFLCDCHASCVPYKENSCLVVDGGKLMNYFECTDIFIYCGTKQWQHIQQ